MLDKIDVLSNLYREYKYFCFKIKGCLGEWLEILERWDEFLVKEVEKVFINCVCVWCRWFVWF